MVSIVIVTMGVDDELRQCVDSVRKICRTEHEIIIVNNIREKIPGDLADSILENGRNLGFARAVNRGIRAASGDFILLLNPDTKFDSDVITPVIGFMEDNEKAGICGIQLIFPDGRLQNSVDIIPNLANQFINKSLLKLLFPGSYPSKRSGYEKPVRVPSVIGAFMMLRRAMLDEIGLLDEGFFFYLEETDLCKRAADAGYEVWHLPGLRLVHYQGSSARKQDIGRTIEFIRSMDRFFFKHQGPAAALAYRGLTMLKSAVEVVTNLPFSFSEKPKNRMMRSAAVFAWLAACMPKGRGLEKAGPVYRMVRSGGYEWFLPEGRSIPGKSPAIILDGLDEVLNRSRTTYIKRGQIPEGEIYLKRYNFKGMKDTLKNLFRKSRALRAMEAALTVEALGLKTPEVVFACEKRVFGILLESFIATRGIKAVNLVELDEAGRCSESLMGDLAAQIRRMHEMGVLHVDLKGENLMVDDAGDMWLIDLDRLKRKRFLSMKDIIRNLSYLNASFVEKVPASRRLEFLDEYIKGNAKPADWRKEIIERIETYTCERVKNRY